jgi:hypothetical protein
MFHSSLNCTIASATVHAESDVVDIAELFGAEVSDSIAEAIAHGYRGLDEMCDAMHSVQSVRMHLAAARWEAEQLRYRADLDLESLDFPLRFGTARKSPTVTAS